MNIDFFTFIAVIAGVLLLNAAGILLTNWIDKLIRKNSNA